ncbi:MAG: hypothetical protein SOY42_08200 [Clostridium sp.]|nr:hypothetical protein [Clostridium sp.]
MAHSNKLYRNFIILQEDEKEHLKDGGKPLSGYAKIEAKSDKCKISFYTQNLKSDDEYFMVLICYKKDMKKIVDLGSLKVDELGKGEAYKDYYINDIAGLNFSYDKISGAGVYKYKDGKPSFLMYGFINGESDCNEWKNLKILKCDDSYKMISEKEKKTFIKEECEKKEHKKKEESKCDCEKCAHKKDDYKEEKCETHDKEKHEECERHKDKECKDYEEKHDFDEVKCNKCDYEEKECVKEKKHEHKEEQCDKEKKHEHKEEQCDKEKKHEHEEIKCDKGKKRENEEVECIKTKKHEHEEECDKEKKHEKIEYAKCEKYDHKEECKNKCKSHDCKKVKYEDYEHNNECQYCEYNEEKCERKDDITLQDPCLSRGEIPITFEEYERKIEERKNKKGIEIISEENIECDEKETEERRVEYNLEENRRNIGYYRNATEKFELKGALGQFFNGVANGFEEVSEEFDEIKYCKWYKVKINSLDDMCDISDYNKYNIVYYPMINYYPYIKKYGYFIIGYKCNKCGDVDYIVYGIPGTRDIDEQPYSGKTGFVTWIRRGLNKEKGCWLMFYDYKKSTVVIPMK